MVSRKCTVAVDAQAQSMCSLHIEHRRFAPREALHPRQNELLVAPVPTGIHSAHVGDTRR